MNDNQPPVFEFEPDQPGAFLGKGMAWPPREDPNTGDFAKAVDEESISDGLLFLIRTTLGEIPSIEDFGTLADRILFETDVVAGAAVIINSIETAIRTHEPRVFVLGVTMNSKGESRNLRSALINVRYRVRATGQIQEGVFPFTSSNFGGEI